MKIQYAVWALVMGGLVACGGEDGAPGTNGSDGTAGPAGPAGGDGSNGASSSGAPGTSSISAITPSAIFIDQSATLVISGVGTSWTAAPTVSFDGSGITVDAVEVASPTALLVTVHTDPTSKAEAHEVTVGTDRFAGFRVSADFVVDSDAPVLAGSMTVVQLTGLNPNRPMTETSLSAPPPVPNPGTVVAGLDGVPLGVGDGIYGVAATNGNGAIAVLYNDIDVVGIYDIDLLGVPSGFGARGRFYGSRTLTLGAPTLVPVATFPHDEAFTASASFIQSRMLTYAMPTTGRLQCTAVPVPAGIQADVVTASTNGHFGDNSTFFKAGETVYLASSATQIGGLTAPVTITTNCAVTAALVTEEAEPNNASANPIVPAGNAVRGSLSTAADLDVFSFTAAGSYNVRLALRKGSSSVSMRVKDNGGNVIATSSLAGGVGNSGPNSNNANVFVSPPAGAASIEVFADNTTTPPQAGGDYELAITP